MPQQNLCGTQRFDQYQKVMSIGSALHPCKTKKCRNIDVRFKLACEQSVFAGSAETGRGPQALT
jgi:hypothetical protein